MPRFATAAAALALAFVSSGVSAQTGDKTRMAEPFLAAAGMSDVFEVTSSQLALMNSQDAEVRRFAQMMIAHHTDTTNGALAAAKRAGVTPPPPALDAAHRDMITALLNSQGAEMSRTYWSQQLQAHEAALALMQGYAANGDTAQLRAAAAATVPVVQSHLSHVRAMAAR
jgi:putative membrane protein